MRARIAVADRSLGGLLEGNGMWIWLRVTTADRLLRCGSASGPLGAFLLVTNPDVSKCGSVALLAASVHVIGFARSIKANGLLLQQAGFLVTR